jgi:hypothetical protein
MRSKRNRLKTSTTLKEISTDGKQTFEVQLDRFITSVNRVMTKQSIGHCMPPFTRRASSPPTASGTNLMMVEDDADEEQHGPMPMSSKKQKNDDCPELSKKPQHAASFCVVSPRNQSPSLVTGNTGTVTFWEAWHAAVPAKRCTCHAVPSGGCSALTVTAPPIFGRSPGDSKTDVCGLPSTRTMTDFSLSHSSSENDGAVHCPSNGHVVVGHDGPHVIVRPAFSHKKTKGCFRQ